MYRTEFNYVLGLVQHKVISKAIAEEVTQDVFVKVLLNVDRYIPQAHKSLRESFRSWVSTIAKNTAINYLKKKRPGEDYYQHKQSSGPRHLPNPEELAIEKEEWEGISQSINDLANHGMRGVARLWFLEDQSYQEISDKLKIPIGTVMSRLGRAREKLRENNEFL